MGRGAGPIRDKNRFAMATGCAGKCLNDWGGICRAFAGPEMLFRVSFRPGVRPLQQLAAESAACRRCRSLCALALLGPMRRCALPNRLQGAVDRCCAEGVRPSA